jgi:hypothetical protein
LGGNGGRDALAAPQFAPCPCTRAPRLRLPRAQRRARGPGPVPGARGRPSKAPASRQTRGAPVPGPSPRKTKYRQYNQLLARTAHPYSASQGRVGPLGRGLLATRISMRSTAKQCAGPSSRLRRYMLLLGTAVIEPFNQHVAPSILRRSASLATDLWGVLKSAAAAEPLRMKTAVGLGAAGS